MKWFAILLLALACTAEASPFGVKPASLGTAQSQYTLANSGGVTVPGIFVAGNGAFATGSDATGDGSTNNPYFTLTKALSAYVVGTITNFWVARGGTNYEQFIVPINCTLSCYGPSNLYGRPVISGVTNLVNANFSKTAGQNYTYEIALIPNQATNNYAGVKTNQVLMVWEDKHDGQGLQRVGTDLWSRNAGFASIANVEANANSFWWNPAVGKLYVHPGDNSSPVTNGFQYAASVRTLCAVGTTNTTINGITAEYPYAYDTVGQEGYPLLAQCSGVIENCLARGGWNHLVGVAPSGGVQSAGNVTNYFYNITAYDMQTNPSSGPGIMYIADTQDLGTTPNNGIAAIFSNCVAGMFGPNAGSNTPSVQHAGFGLHEANDTVQFINCVATNFYIGFQPGTNCTLFSNCIAANCWEGILTPDQTNSVSGFTAYSCAYGIKANSGNFQFTLVNSKFWHCRSAAIFTSTTSTNGFYTNNVFAATNGVGVGINSGGRGYLDVNSLSNSFFGLNYCYDYGTMTNAAGTDSSDFNNYYGCNRYASDMNPSPGYFISWSNWTNAWSGKIDWHSTNTNSTALYPNSAFVYTAPDPSGP